MGSDPRRKMTANDHPVSTRILIEMDEDENERESKKNVKFADNIIIKETSVLTYLHLKFFLSQMQLFKYYIDDAV